MRTVTTKTNVYKFDELSEKVQSIVINEHIEFILEDETEFLSPNVLRAIEDAEKMRTPWFTGEYILEYARDEVMESVRENEYLITGEIFA